VRIAVIGMAARFPGARDVAEYWQNLVHGVESIRNLSVAELESAGVDEGARSRPAYVARGGVLDDADAFDHGFFGFSPADASILDPQHRLFLECCWHAIEDAGYDVSRLTASVGVVGGCAPSALSASSTSYENVLGNDVDFLTTRVSYKLNLRGPSVSVQTGCSTSLVAVHQACESLRRGECDMALAGAVSIAAETTRGYHYQEGMIFSPDGHCRPFDAAGRGTVSGDGVGVVVLKRLDDALRDGDEIRAVIAGSAVNNDGSSKLGFTAPSIEGQLEVLRAALTAAGVDASSVSFIECHGTATELGDPAEVTALQRVYGGGRPAETCALGSVKSNLGHLDRAAGMAGLIKAILALQHGVLPPTLHFERPNPHLDFSTGPFYVNRTPQAWSTPAPRHAGVSAFGIGGTNAHLIVTEAPAVEGARAARSAPFLLCLSGRSAAGLEAAQHRLADWLEQHDAADLLDVAYTLAVGRKAFPYRGTWLVHDRLDAIKRLRSGPGSTAPAPAEGETVHVEALRDNHEPDALWGTLGRLWRHGALVDWATAYAGLDCRRVSLPGYVFERTRFAHHEALNGVGTTPHAAVASDRLDDWFWVESWSRALPLSALPRLVRVHDGRLAEEAAWVLLTDARWGSAVASRLGPRVVTVEPAASFERVDAMRYHVRPLERDDFAKLLSHLANDGIEVQRIVHAWSLTPDPEIGLWSLLWLAQAAAARQDAATWDLVVLTKGAHEVAGERTGRPESAMLAPLCKVIDQELAQLRCRTVDLDPASEPDDALLDALAAECMTPTDEVDVAWRGGYRWAQDFMRVSLPCPPQDASVRGPWKAGSTWLITGGLGALGLTVARALATEAGARLVLVGRTPLPPRDQWKQILSDAGDAAMQRRLEALLAIEKEAAAIMIAHADVTDAAAIAEVIETARQRFGPLDGVIHAAGVPGGGFVSDLEPAAVRACLAPKVRGTQVLVEALERHPPTLFVMFSSLSVCLGGLGLGDYAAANAFMDAFARGRRGSGPTRFISINWGPWLVDGMAPGAAEGWLEERLQRLDEVAGIAAQKGIEALGRILASGLDHVAVSRQPLDVLHKRMRGDNRSGVGKRPSVANARKSVDGPSEAPGLDAATATERQIADIWRKLLGVEAISIHDDFFDLGGHSLLATKVMAELRATFGVNIPLRVIFEARTAADMAQLIDDMAWATRPDAPAPGQRQQLIL
jgi:acyl transferase domain-containing protein/acyl carrier protein